MKLDASNLKINSQQAESIKRNFDSRRAIKNYQKNGIVIDKRYYAQTQAIIYKGEEQSPRASQVWGIVAHPERETRKSPSAQTYTIHDDAESASVQSRNNWYDVGHVMGLNLGGSDDARNYILQAPDTNETGPWRAMERAVNQKAKELLREKEPGVIYFGVTVVYTENPKNVYELYIPTALNVYLYQIPYAEYQKLAIEELLPSESYNSLDKYIFKVTDEIKDQAISVSQEETASVAVNKSEDYTSYSNLLNEKDITHVLEGLANNRIEAVIEYLQGENLFALALDKTSKSEIDEIQDEYEILEENSALFLKKKECKEGIDLTKKIADKDVGCFSADTTMNILKLKAVLTNYLERRSLNLKEQEEKNRDILNDVATMTGKRAEKAEQLEGISLPTINDDIQSFFHYKLAFADQCSASPQLVQTILEESEKITEGKIEKSTKDKNFVLEKKLKNYEELEEILKKAHHYLQERPFLEATGSPQQPSSKRKYQYDSAEEQGSKVQSSSKDAKERGEPPVKKSKTIVQPQNPLHSTAAASKKDEELPAKKMSSNSTKLGIKR